MKYVLILWCLLLCSNLLAGEPEASQPTVVAITEGKGDFLATPPLPSAVLLDRGKLQPGAVGIVYKSGQIINVTIEKSSGDEELDSILCKHILGNYRVRPQTNGVVVQPFDFGQLLTKYPDDFISAPNLVIPYSLKKDLLRQSIINTVALLTYRDGKFIHVSLLKSTGNKTLDRLIIDHVIRNFRIKSHASGSLRMPISANL